MERPNANKQVGHLTLNDTEFEHGMKLHVSNYYNHECLEELEK